MRVLAGLVMVAMIATAVAQQPSGGDAPPSDTRALAEAYKRAGSPRVLVEAHGTQEVPKALTAGLITGVESALRSAGVTLVDAEELDAEERTALQRQDSYTAARTLGQRAGAGVVLYVRVSPAAGQGLSASYVLADLRRGSTLGRGSWAMARDASDEQVRGQAEQLFREVAAQMERGLGAGAPTRRVPVRIVGAYRGEDLPAFQRALGDAGAAALRAEDRSGPASVATIDMAYGGEIADLRKLVARAAIDHLAMRSMPVDGREGALAVRLEALPLSGRERLLTGGARTGANSTERDRLLLAHAAAGRPQVGLTVVTEDNKQRDEVEGPIPVQPPGRGGSALPAQQVLARRWGEVGVPVRVLERTGLPTPAEGWTDRSLALATAKAAGVPLVLVGVVRSGDGRSELLARVYDGASGRVLGSWKVEASGEDWTEEAAALATAKVLVQLADYWETLPRR